MQIRRVRILEGRPLFNIDLKLSDVTFRLRSGATYRMRFGYHHTELDDDGQRDFFELEVGTGEYHPLEYTLLTKRYNLSRGSASVALQRDIWKLAEDDWNVIYNLLSTQREIVDKTEITRKLKQLRPSPQD